MRVVCPYVLAGDPGVERGLHPLCERSLAKFAPGAEMHYLGTRHDAYRDLLGELWEAGEGFLLVEHDIELHDQVIPSLERCLQPWCVHPYAIGWPPAEITSSLGCTRFSTGLIRAIPDLISGLPVRDWRRLDCEIAPRLMQAGFRPHVHAPAVRHHHAYPAPGGVACACGEEHA